MVSNYFEIKVRSALIPIPSKWPAKCVAANAIFSALLLPLRGQLKGSPKKLELAFPNCQLLIQANPVSGKNVRGLGPGCLKNHLLPQQCTFTLLSGGLLLCSATDQGAVGGDVGWGLFSDGLSVLELPPRWLLHCPSSRRQVRLFLSVSFLVSFLHFQAFLFGLSDCFVLCFDCLIGLFNCLNGCFKLF